jgi:Ca2+-binding EF-hand superfamily protein
MKFGHLAVVAAASSLFVALLSPAAAQGVKQDMVMKRIKGADKDKDGLISREEAKSLPRLEKNFDAMDTNKDGQISEEELVAFREKGKK